MAREPEVLKLHFEDAEAFEREYTANLVHRGVFVPSEESFSLREFVHVELTLDFCGARMELEAEVVQRVPRELVAEGGVAGVALQFRLWGDELTRALKPLVLACGDFEYQPPPLGQRAAARAPARVPARVRFGRQTLEGQTRDLSKSGVLVAVPGGGVPVGETVKVSFQHPTSDEVMEVKGRVARRLEAEGEVTALGIEFKPGRTQRSKLERFVDDVVSAEHARRLGAISGPIQQLGPQSLLQMFGTSAPAGTLILKSGAQEGAIGFEGGLLRYVRLGSASGLKALVRMMSWADGAFEFHAHVEAPDKAEAPLPLDAALFEAVRLVDEGKRIDRARLAPKVRVSVCDRAEAGGERGKIEAAVLDLARANLTVQRILDLIPEPDPEILKAFEQLLDDGAIALDSSPDS